MSTASKFEELALEALPEVLDELGYPRANRGRLCDWFDFPESLPDRDRTEFCLDFADGRPGYLTVRVPTNLSDAETKAEIKRQLHEYGIVPGVQYVRPPE